MANIDRPFGFLPWGPVLRATLYAVATNPTLGFYHGDAVHLAGASLATRFGNRHTIAQDNVIASNDRIVGVITSVFDEDMNPIAYMAPSRTGDSTVAGYLMVADHPDQTFLIQEDGETTPIPAASAEMNIDFAGVALNAGNTASGVSKMELDSNTVNTTVTLRARLVYPHPDDTVASAYCRWVIVFNLHQYGHVGRVGMITTT